MVSSSFQREGERERETHSMKLRGIYQNVRYEIFFYERNVLGYRNKPNSYLSIRTTIRILMTMMIMIMKIINCNSSSSISSSSSSSSSSCGMYLDSLNLTLSSVSHTF